MSVNENVLSDPAPIDAKEIQSCIMDETKQDLESEDMNEEEMIASAMSGDKIKALLSADGPTVKAVLLKTDGTAEEISYDSTPSKNHVKEILGAPPSIIGQYPDLDVIVVGPRCDEKEEQFKVNQHKLRYPFNNDTFYGDVFLYRFNQKCVVEDFTLNEYNVFAAKSDEDIGKVFKPLIDADNVEYDDDDNDADEEYDAEEEAQYAQDFMRQIIVNKIKAEFPQKFGREPTEEELESYIAGTMQAAGALFGFGAEEDEDYNPENDEMYDPTDDQQQADQDEEEDIVDEQQLDDDKKDIESDQNKDKLPLMDVDEEEEEKMVNSENFETELMSAIESIQNMAQFDKEKILLMAKEQYMRDTGEEPTEEMLEDAVKMFAGGDQAVDDEEEQEMNEDIDPKMLNEAFENVTKLGASHQEEFIKKISGTFTELNGVEPTTEQIATIFGRIKEQFAEEVREEFLEMNEDDNNDENDEDYQPNDEDMQQVEDDKKMELLDELVQKKEDEDERKPDEKVKILVTPVKRRPSGSSVGIYLKNQQDTDKTLEFASSKFEQINGRAPNDTDTQRLKDFLTTGMLFESEVDTTKPVNNNDDDEEDEDYTPENDKFDYSRDIADDLQFQNEYGMDENENTSNMIDID